MNDEEEPNPIPNCDQVYIFKHRCELVIKNQSLMVASGTIESLLIAYAKKEVVDFSALRRFILAHGRLISSSVLITKIINLYA